MENINFFLEKFRNIKVPNDSLFRIIQASILKNVGVEVGREQISFQKGRVFIKVGPIEKSEIILRKDKIIEDLENSLPGELPKDIR